MDRDFSRLTLFLITTECYSIKDPFKFFFDFFRLFWTLLDSLFQKLPNSSLTIILHTQNIPNAQSFFYFWRYFRSPPDVVSRTFSIFFYLFKLFCTLLDSLFQKLPNSFLTIILSTHTKHTKWTEIFHVWRYFWSPPNVIVSRILSNFFLTSSDSFGLF